MMFRVQPGVSLDEIVARRVNQVGAAPGDFDGAFLKAH